MKNYIVLKVISKLLIPYIFLFGLYVQIHGKVTPGGGFQAGVIFASAFILFCFIFGMKKTIKVISFAELKTLSAIGVLLYVSVGFATLIAGGNFLDYSTLASNPKTGQFYGIFLVEVGVGITVFATILLIFLVFTNRNKVKPIKKKNGKTS